EQPNVVAAGGEGDDLALTRSEMAAGLLIRLFEDLADRSARVAGDVDVVEVREAVEEGAEVVAVDRDGGDVAARLGEVEQRLDLLILTRHDLSATLDEVAAAGADALAGLVFSLRAVLGLVGPAVGALVALVLIQPELLGARPGAGVLDEVEALP